MGEVPQEIARRVKGGMVEKDIMQSGQYAARRDADAGKMCSDYLAEVTRAGRRDGLAMADLGAFRPRGRRHRRNASAADVVGTGEQRGGIGERRYPGELSANIDGCPHLAIDREDPVETRAADRGRPARADPLGERQHPDL